jgi:predicted CXXCH cytochrome family protein
MATGKTAVSGVMRMRFRCLLLAALATSLGAGCGDAEAPTAAADTPPPSGSEPASQEIPLAFVGSDTCAGCHPEEAARWQGSHHELAMQPATPQTVLGDFADAAYDGPGDPARFSRDGETFQVTTAAADGSTRSFDVSHVFGVEPLQQVLITGPDGRVQALTTAWDARPADEGGQRWYALYADEPPPPGDRLHWTGIDQNWNHMCAECHTTGFAKGFDAAADRFATSAAEERVGCEACHGRGSRHVVWAEAGGRSGAFGLAAPLANDTIWERSASEPIAHAVGSTDPGIEVATCAPCHSRRTSLFEGVPPGRPLLESHRPALLEEGLYFADGQIQDEVYVWGSFLQSRMAAAGVRCSDCHEPHDLSLRAEGNALCVTCHDPERYDTDAHHHHTAGTEAAACVSCHMTARTYMGVDARRDHSFRVPRPDLGPTLGTPDACTGCHDDFTPVRAAETIRTWTGGAEPPPHFGTALHAGRTGALDAAAQLAALAEAADTSAIVRATAVSLIPSALNADTFAVLERAAHSEDGLVRLATATAIDGLPPEVRLPIGAPLLADPLATVRLEAAASLADVPPDAWSPRQRTQLAGVLAEYRAVQELHADRPASQLNLGLLHSRVGEYEEALASYREARRIDPTFTPAIVNEVDLLRALERDAEGGPLLEQALELQPDEPTLLYTRGLQLVRAGRTSEALPLLQRAAELAPERIRFAFVYAIGLHGEGRSEEARDVLAEARQRRPGARDVLGALIEVELALGRPQAAFEVAKDLAVLLPGDPGVGQLLEDIAKALHEQP